MNSKAEIVHAVNMKHDPVINEIRPYLTEPALEKFLTKDHQKDIRVVIKEINNIDQSLEPREPAAGDLDFESDQDSPPCQYTSTRTSR